MGEAISMGFGDKLKASMSNANSRLNQEADEASFNSKINDKKKEKEEALNKAGEKLYEVYISGKTEVTDEVKAFLDTAKGCDDEIAKLEKEKQDMKDKAQKERDDRRAEVKAKEEEEKKKKEEEKAAKEAAKKE